MYKPTEREDYLPEWPSFHRVFGLHMRAASASCHVELDTQLDTEFRASSAPHIVLVDRLVRAIQGFEARRAEFDVLFIYIPQRWAPGYVGGPTEDFDLHDHLKAATAARRLPIQLVREDKALAYPDRASVMWRIPGWRSTRRQAGCPGSWRRWIRRPPTSASPTPSDRLNRTGLASSPAVAKSSMPRVRTWSSLLTMPTRSRSSGTTRSSHAPRCSAS